MYEHKYDNNHAVESRLMWMKMFLIVEMLKRDVSNGQKNDVGIYEIT